MAISTELWLAWCAYLAWLAAGCGDFLCHWRTDLPHTSGLAESASHLVQLALLGIGVVIGLAFATGRTSLLLLSALVVAHAIAGYIDTWIAFRRHRIVSPVEQHIHGILDMAPIIALAWLVVSTWPAAIEGGWRLQWRRPQLPPGAWIAVLAPSVLLTVVPALLEWRAARAVARNA